MEDALTELQGWACCHRAPPTPKSQRQGAERRHSYNTLPKMASTKMERSRSQEARPDDQTSGRSPGGTNQPQLPRVAERVAKEPPPGLAHPHEDSKFLNVHR